MIKRFQKWVDDNDLRACSKKWIFTLCLLLILAAGVYQIAQNIVYLWQALFRK